MAEETIEERVERLRKFKGKISILACACGHEIETDMPVDPFLALPCNRCGATKWTQKNVGKAIKRDPSAPTELKEDEEE